MFLFFVVHLATTISVIFNGWRSWASESGKSDAERNANQAMPAPKRHTNKSPTAAVPAAGCPHFECHRVATIPTNSICPPGGARCNWCGDWRCKLEQRIWWHCLWQVAPPASRKKPPNAAPFPDPGFLLAAWHVCNMQLMTDNFVATTAHAC